MANIMLLICSLSQAQTCQIISAEGEKDFTPQNEGDGGKVHVDVSSVAKPPLFWAAPAPDGRGPRADSGSDLLGLAPAPGKKRRLQAAPAPYTKIFHFKLSKS